VKKNFDPEKGGAGAWEIAARVSRVDLEDAGEGLDAGTLTDFTAALNWYLNPVTRIMLNHVVGQVETPAWEGDVHSTQARFQIDF
jgi:phosphate-selective porin OprO/OprP